VRIGAPDRSLTPNAGLVAVSELCGRLGVIGVLDAAVGPVKQRDRGFGAGELLTGIAAAQLAGEDFLTGLDRQRADPAGRQVTPVPGLSSTTAAGLARRITPGQWLAVEAGLAAVTGRMLPLLPAARAAALTEGPVTIDLDTTDVEVYGRKKRGVAYNHQGQRAGRPHVASWLRPRSRGLLTWATGLMTRARPRRICCAARWPPCRSGSGPGGWGCVPTRGTSPVPWPAPPMTRGSRSRSAPGGSRRCGGCWPASPRRTGPRRSRWTAPRSRRRTLRPDQRARPIPGLADAGVIDGYSSILTNLDVSAPGKAAADRYLAVAAHRHRCPAHPPRRVPDPAAAARPQPAPRDPGPAAGPARSHLTCAS
jgi:hypothetical protein